MKKSVFILFIVVALGIFATQVRGDDTTLFMTQAAPDAMLILDMSRSMNFDVSGKNENTSPPNRRIDIARSVLYNLLDSLDDDDTRLGYMRFIGGAVEVKAPIPASRTAVRSKIAEGVPSGGTPLAEALEVAKNQFKTDSSSVCRKKFVVLITDGEDTLACKGDGTQHQTDMYKRRLATVQKANELKAAGIQVFVIGFGGDLPDELKKTLNWSAKYGGTDNPLEANSGDTEAYNVTEYGSACTAATSADPALYKLSGYAFLPDNAEKLAEALKSIFGEVVEASYSFGTPTVPSIRVVDQDRVYIGSFEPNSTPFWQGHLKAYQLNADGTVPVDASGNPGTPVWKASTGDPNLRKIYTVLNDGNSLVEFNSENVKNTDLDVDENLKEKLINHIRGLKDPFDVNRNGKTEEARSWTIGDIFHSNAVVVGPPSPTFEDLGFNEFRQQQLNWTTVILVGANDGMLHAFDANTGMEEWAYVPNGVLKQLRKMSEDQSVVHNYYVDSSPKVADVVSDAKKEPKQWKTVLVCGLRKGGKSYFALDITDTTNPKFLWEFPKSSSTPPLTKMGESWSEPAIGRVKIEEGEALAERWVVFVGAGFDPNEKIDKDATAGRGFFVIDILTGELLWEFSYDKGGKKDEMGHSSAAPPKAVDLNFDGYVDRVYIGDLGGQMWVFDVSFDAVRNISKSRWTGKRLFVAPKEKQERHPIYYQPSVALDPSGTPWVFFGTGDRENIREKNTQDRFYAVKDDDARGTTPSDEGGYPYSEEDLSDVTSTNTYTRDLLKKGWFIKLANGEKVLARPMVYNRIVYFTTYTYTEPDICKVGGTGKLYAVEYLSGGGATDLSNDVLSTGVLKLSDRSVVTTGSGLPSAPVITINTAGVASVIVGSVSGQLTLEKTLSLARDNEILYWREVIP